jgi:hypothetical protein
MKLDELKRELRSVWRDDPVADLCLRLVSALENLPGSELQMLTFGTINQILKKPEIDDEVLRALAILVGSRLHVLDTHYLLLDQHDRELEVDGSDVEEARAVGYLPHPYTGEQIPDFEDRVFPYFAASDRFLRLKAGMDG